MCNIYLNYTKKKRKAPLSWVEWVTIGFEFSELWFDDWTAYPSVTLQHTREINFDQTSYFFRYLITRYLALYKVTFQLPTTLWKPSILFVYFYMIQETKETSYFSLFISLCVFFISGRVVLFFKVILGSNFIIYFVVLYYIYLVLVDKLQFWKPVINYFILKNINFIL